MPGELGGGSGPTASGTTDERPSSVTESGRTSGENSPMMMSPWNQSSAFVPPSFAAFGESVPQNALVGSLVREEGHIYSLAVTGGVLYTGSESKNIRVWKSLKEFSGFKANSGLVKAIVLSNGKIYTGHQDGKIRVWKVSPRNPAIHRRSGTLPTLKDIFKSSINPSNYKEVRRRRTLWIKHSDAVSSLSLNDAVGLLYSASWDRTVKVWRLSDSKCLESLSAHEDAVNSVIGHVEDMVFTASADGTVKMWRREVMGSRTKHYHDQTLLMQESSVTALAVNGDGSFLYCGSSDGVVNYWERDEDQLTHGGVVKGHKLAVLCLATAGSVVFSGSADKTICVWRREGGAHTCLSVLTGHTGPVKCLTVEIDPESSSSQNNNNNNNNNGGGDNDRWIVYSGSLDKSVKVWSVTGRAVNVNNLLDQPPVAFGTAEVGGGLGQIKH